MCLLPGGKEVESIWWESHRTNFPIVGLDHLNLSCSTNVIKRDCRVFMSRNEKSSSWVNTNWANRRLGCVGRRICEWWNHTHAPPSSQVPESNCLVLWTTCKHCTTPVGQRQYGSWGKNNIKWKSQNNVCIYLTVIDNLTWMAWKWLEWGSCDAVRHINFAIPSPSTYKQGGFITQVFNKANVSNGPIMHSQLHLRRVGQFFMPTQLFKSHQLHCLIVAPCCQQVSIGGPSQAVNWSLKDFKFELSTTFYKFLRT